MANKLILPGLNQSAESVLASLGELTEDQKAIVRRVIDRGTELAIEKQDPELTDAERNAIDVEYAGCEATLATLGEDKARQAAGTIYAVVMDLVRVSEDVALRRVGI